ncbi:MAG: KHG/KDPG aldolase/sugar kinase fusion protein [Candidatus Zhuqueibacterota bacterium]
MNKSEQLFAKLKEKKLIGLLTPKNVEECLVAYETLNPLGVVLEIAFRSEAAFDGVAAVLNKYPDALILAGTVMTKKQAKKAIEVGVAGIVSADYIPEVVEQCAKHDVMCIPGGTADCGKQLVHKAKEYECDLAELKEKYPYQWIYKLFPAATESQSNVELANAWKGPFKGLIVVYTGGISLSNLAAVVKQDPDGIFCGSAVTKSIDDPAKMKKVAEKWLEIIHQTGTKKAAPTRAASHAATPGQKVVTFGEIMLRLSPPNMLRFVQTKNFDATFGGAEANTSVAFANYGLESVFVTALPDHEIGQSAINSLRQYGVDTRFILRQGERVGVYYLEYGASQRPSKVVYDRAGASIAEIKPGQVDWTAIFQGAAWFHWSGITPALSDSASAVTLEALKAAKNAGAMVSVDLNYRKKLWSKEKAQRVMAGLMEYVDVAIGNEEDAECVFGIKAGASDVTAGKLDIQGYKDVARQMVDRFGFSKVAITLRESISASDNIWSACLYNGADFLLSKKYDIRIVDRVGGGDSFSSGLIYGLIVGKSDADALEFGVAASCLKQTIHGDFNLVSVKEVELLSGGDVSGRVQR